MNSTSILDLIMVEKNAGTCAIICHDGRISYSQMDELSDRLAKNIIDKGVKPGSIIALGLYNDIDLIPSILAIWKANCVYLPIDPNYPSSRIEMMLEDAFPKLLITKQELQSKFSFFKGQRYIIDEEHGSPNIELKQPKPDDFSYLMYTSGSTGKPKGIIVDHFALKHSALAYNELHPEKHTALVSGSISFDPSLLTIVSTLAKGGTLCLYSNRDGIDKSQIQDIADLIEKNSVSFILSTPSFYSKLIQQNRIFSTLKNVDLCGEDISGSLIELHKMNAPNAVLLNVYGPTEYAMGVTAGLIYNPAEKKLSQVTIGKPFSCNKLYILDSDLNRVKSGEKGEIFVGGPGLAAGYFKKEELTEEKFLLLDHLENHPIKLYRTGDIGYSLPNGDIVFVGRADLQVKINGHRVELEEVEKFICEYRQIQRVVVLAVQIDNYNQLVAFISGNEKICPNQLREFLFRHLPPYMIPSKLIQISNWPLTNNGKVDRKALEKFL